MKDLERRFRACEIRAEEKDGTATITGRPIVFGERTDLGWFDEIIEPGALDGTDLTDVRFLVNHDTSMIPLARSRRNNGNSTMTLAPTHLGLDMVANVDVENNTTARELKSAIERGDISGMSFMFSVEDADQDWVDMDTDHPTRHIRKISSVVEVSAVTFPAYDATTINTRSKEALENARSALEKVRQADGDSLEKEDIDLLKAKVNLIAKI